MSDSSLEEAPPRVVVPELSFPARPVRKRGGQALVKGTVGTEERVRKGTLVIVHRGGAENGDGGRTASLLEGRTSSPHAGVPIGRSLLRVLRASVVRGGTLNAGSDAGR